VDRLRALDARYVPRPGDRRCLAWQGGFDVRQSLAGYAGLAVLVSILSAACGPLQSEEAVTSAAVTDVAAATASTTIPVTTAVPLTATTPMSATTQGRDERYRHIGPAQLAQTLGQRNFLLVNTHEPYGCQIDGTDSHVPVDDEGRWLRGYPDDKTAKIVLHCRSGNWSTVAAERLVTAGYTDLWDLDGGMGAWQATGLPLVAD